MLQSGEHNEKSFLHIGLKQGTFRKLENPDDDLQQSMLQHRRGKRWEKHCITTHADRQARSYLPNGGLSPRVLVTSRYVQADEVLLSQEPVGSLEFGFVVSGAGWTEL